MKKLESLDQAEKLVNQAGITIGTLINKLTDHKGNALEDSDNEIVVKLNEIYAKGEDFCRDISTLKRSLQV